MAIAFVQQKLTAGTIASTLQVTDFGAVANTAGNLLTCLTGYQSSGAVSTITDSAGNLWLKATNKLPAGTAASDIECWYAANCLGSTNRVTVNCSGSTTALTWQTGIHEWSGAKTASVVGTSSGLAGLSTNVLKTGGLSSPTANSLVLAAWRVAGAYTNTSEPAGYSTLAPNQQTRVNADYKILGASPGAEDPAWTIAAVQTSWVGIIVEFLAAAATTTGNATLTLLGFQ